MSTGNLILALQRAVGFEHLGYGTFGLALEGGLKDIGLSVVVPPTMENYHIPPQNQGCVIWASQPSHGAGRWEGQYTVCFTMWESTRLPEGFSSHLHNYDLVVVPNAHNLELVKEFNPNVVKVPLGYNHYQWTPITRIPPKEEFRFLMCAAGATEKARKGTDLAIKAFEYAFPNWQNMSPKPTLTIKCLKHPPEDRPFLTNITGRVEISALRGLYANCHAMVLPSRGEGWGYHPCQAVATGMPAIVSDIPGHHEFNWIPGFYTVPVKEVKALPFIQGDGGNWWEPDLDEIIAGMRDVYEDYETWTKAAQDGSEQMAGRFTQRHMAEQLVGAIGLEYLTTKETGEWQPFTEREYLSTVSRPLGKGECDIGGVSYELLPGKEYWLPANARNVIREAGFLGNPEQCLSRV